MVSFLYGCNFTQINFMGHLNLVDQCSSWSITWQGIEINSILCQVFLFSPNFSSYPQFLSQELQEVNSYKNFMQRLIFHDIFLPVTQEEEIFFNCIGQMPHHFPYIFGGTKLMQGLAEPKIAVFTTIKINIQSLWARDCKARMNILYLKVLKVRFCL